MRPLLLGRRWRGYRKQSNGCRGFELGGLGFCLLKGRTKAEVVAAEEKS